MVTGVALNGKKCWQENVLSTKPAPGMGVFVSAFIALSFIAIPEPHLRKAGHEKEKFQDGCGTVKNEIVQKSLTDAGSG